MSVSTDSLHQTIEGILPGLVALRHELHAHPEIRFEEHWTSDRIARFLDDIGVPYTRGHAKGTGIVATLEGGQSGKTVALRADMDALEIHEQTGVPYASTIAGRMHACGHDGHMTCLCGAIQTLAEHRERLEGSVKFIFQPAEELAAGGRFIVEEGVLDGVDGVFALHAWPTLPVGGVGLRPGWMMATADSFHITVEGRGCHGADPAAGVDPITVAAYITTALQTIVSREIDPADTGVVTVGKIAAGEATNVIPEEALIEGTLRAMEPDLFERIAESIERIAVHTASAFRASAHVRFGGARYPSLYNDEAATAFVHETAVDLFGSDRVVTLPKPCMAAEDFAFYLQRVPGAFICLGNNGDPSKPHPPLHSPHFNFNDDAIPTAVELFATLALRGARAT